MEAGRLLLEISDDGKGFDPRAEKGMGLLGMEERVGHLGGSFAVDSGEGRGVVIHVSLPVAAHDHAAPHSKPQEVA
jgi:signal transduction histidine kinase